MVNFRQFSGFPEIPMKLEERIPFPSLSSDKFFLTSPIHRQKQVLLNIRFLLSLTVPFPRNLPLLSLTDVLETPFSNVDTAPPD